MRKEKEMDTNEMSVKKIRAKLLNDLKYVDLKINIIEVLSNYLKNHDKDTLESSLKSMAKLHDDVLETLSTTNDVKLIANISNALGYYECLSLIKDCIDEGDD